MTSPNNHLHGNRGSALVVTILLVSVMLTAALILLQRIIPYAKNVRGMNDAVQAYYTARGQVEAGRYGFFYTGGETIALRMPTLFGLLSVETGNQSAIMTSSRINIIGKLSDTQDLRQSSDTISAHGNTREYKLQKIGLPNWGNIGKLNRDHIVSAMSPDLPLKIKLFSTDATPKYFGTSKRDPQYHTLNPNKSGGLRFDLRGVNTQNDFGLTLYFKDSPPTGAKITIKMQYTSKDGATVKTFTIDHDISSAITSLPITGNTNTGNLQTIASDGGVTAEYNKKISDLLALKCSDVKTCSLSLTLSGTDIPVDFQLVSSGTGQASIPDLNAVVIGDGLSDNGLYFQRVMDLIPTRQDI